LGGSARRQNIMAIDDDSKYQSAVRDPGLFARFFLRIYANVDAARFMAAPSSNAFVDGWVVTQWVVVVSALVVELVASILKRPFPILVFVGLALAMYVLAEFNVRGHEDEQSHDRQLMVRYRTTKERIKTALILVLGSPLAILFLILLFR